MSNVDIKVWKEDGASCAIKIRQSFSEKEVTLPLVFHSKERHTLRLKLVTLSEEVRRRLRNKERDHTKPQVEEILVKFCQKMTVGFSYHHSKSMVIT